MLEHLPAVEVGSVLRVKVAQQPAAAAFLIEKDERVAGRHDGAVDHDIVALVSSNAQPPALQRDQPAS